MAALLKILVLCSILAVAEVCEMDEFKCVSLDGQTESCIDKSRLCNGYNDCEDNSDELNCTVTEHCDVDELSCTMDASPVCYNITTDICVPGVLQLPSKCDNHEDMQYCRCSDNAMGSEPIRCPTNGLCFDSTNETEWCKNCPGAKNCDKSITPKECGADPDYFSCQQTRTLFQCFPISALCDSYRHCEDYYDDPNNSPCVPAEITLTTGPPEMYYMGEDMTLTYTVKGTPTPKYTVYHYGKPLTLPMTMDASSVDAVLVGSTLQITLTNIGIKNYGTYDVAVWNVVNEQVDNNPMYSFHHRVLAEQVMLDFAAGVPTVSIEKEGVPLDSDVTEIVQTVNDYVITCHVTGYPEPQFYFTLDGVKIYANDERFVQNATEYSNATKMQTGSLTFVKGHYTAGTYGCEVMNELVPPEETISCDYSLTVKVLTSPEIVSWSGVNGMLYYKKGADVTLTCEATGDPLPLVRILQDETVLVEANTGSGSVSVSHTLSSYSGTETFACTAVSQIDDVLSETSGSVTLVPVEEPSISMISNEEDLSWLEGDDVSVSFLVQPGIDENNGQYEVTYSLTGVNDSNVWSVSQAWDQEGHTREFNITAASAGLANIGTISVEVDTTTMFYSPVSNSVDVNIWVPAIVLGGLENMTEVQLNNSVNLTVKVQGNPNAYTATWSFNDSVSMCTNTSKEMDSDYTTMFTCTVNATKEHTGTYAVTIVQDKIPDLNDSVTITSSTFLDVIEDPCLMDPCQNNGTCNSTGSNLDYTCDCKLGFTGENCEINTWCEKDLNPCQNDASCLTRDMGEPYYPYYCQCRFGYIDRNCSYEIDFCEDSTELHDNATGKEICGDDEDRGICMHTREEPRGFDCYCAFDWTGLSCTLKPMCSPNPCQNDGTCMVTGEGDEREWSCTCADGWEGTTCTEKKAGYCWDDQCNGNGLCDESDSCLCNFPFYSADCSQVVGEASKLAMMGNGYLEVKTLDAYMADQFSQHVALPVVIKDTTSNVFSLSGASGDRVDAEIQGDDLLITVTQADKTTTLTLNSISKNEPVTVMVSSRDYYFVVSVETRSSGEVVSVSDTLTSPLGALTEMRLGNPDPMLVFDPEQALLLWGELHVGAGQVNLVKEAAGQCVEDAGLCGVDLCLNAGVCDSATGGCNCTGTGFMGQYCEIPDNGDCTGECLNGGNCGDGYCHCPLGYRGVICEKMVALTSQMWISGQSSHLSYHSSDSISSLHVSWMDMSGDFTSAPGARTTILTVGVDANSIQVIVVDSQLYLVVKRAGKVGVYDPDVIFQSSVNGTFMFDLEFSTQNIIMRTLDENSSDEGAMVDYVIDSLPSDNGLPDYTVVEVPGLKGVTARVLVHVNGVAINPSAGTNAVEQDTTDICDGMCGNGECQSMDNMVRCNCPANATNLVTCLDTSCSMETCAGTCSQMGECVCDFSHHGSECRQGLAFAPHTFPMTVSKYDSYVTYDKGQIISDRVVISFYMWLASESQKGVLMSTGTGDIRLSIHLDDETLTATAKCSDNQQASLSISGVTSQKWTHVSLSWIDTQVSLQVDLSQEQVLLGMCGMVLDGKLFLGGAPNAFGVISTFADVIAFSAPIEDVPTGGMGLTLADIHVCQGPTSPCSVIGSVSCDEGVTNTEYSCTCKDNYTGDDCSEEIVPDPCADTVCKNLETCVAGACVCQYPNLASNDCSDTMTDELLGFCFEDAGSVEFDTNPGGSLFNNFDMRFRLVVPSDLPVGNYSVLGFVFDGMLMAQLNVEKTQASDGSTEVLLYPSPTGTFMGFSAVLDPGTTATIRVKIDGSGTVMELNDKKYQNIDMAIVVPPRIIFGKVESAAYPGCYHGVTVNGKPVSSVISGVGVKECNDVAMEELRIDTGNFGVDLWDVVGVL